MNERHAELVAAACEARRHSYSPYSRFRVGAALIDDRGRMHTGTNVENASFGLSICAERADLAGALIFSAAFLYIPKVRWFLELKILGLWRLILGNKAANSA